MTNINNIPAELRDTGLFCLWKYEERNGKQTKVPYNPRTGGKAQPNNPETFAPLAVAVSLQANYDGLGIGIFGGVCSVDIDHCVDEDGCLSELAADILINMNSYTEYSPSGKGLRILFKAAGFVYDTAKYYINNQKIGLEIYVFGATNKYVTVTGNAVAADLEMAERGEQLQVILDKYMRREKPASPKDIGFVIGAATSYDSDIIATAKKASNGALFSALWAGDITGYNSHSEADLALCNMLAFYTGRDAGQMDRLFRSSGLMRSEKWDRPQSGSTYGALTIQNAISKCRSVYNPQEYSQKKADAKTLARSVKPPDYSDAGNAEVFSRIYKDDLLYVDALGWLWWDGKVWVQNDHKALAVAVQLSKMMLDEAVSHYAEALRLEAEAKAAFAAQGDDASQQAVSKAKEEVERVGAYLKHAKGSRGASKIKAMAELSKPAFIIKAEALDANPFDLNTPTGIVDLRTGALRPHDRSAYCSRITKAAPGAGGADMWESFLDATTDGDGSVKGFLQFVAGMAAIGSVYHEGIIIAYGPGGNGKSTYFNAVKEILGSYSGGIDVKTLTTDRQNRGASLATLRGRRLVVTGELEEHQRLSVATLKQIGSTDTLTIEEKYKSPEDVKPSHTLCLFTNHLPRVGSTDHGTWRRITVVPFLHKVSSQTDVLNYAEVLAEQAGGVILSWIIEGAVNFCRNKFKLEIPAAVTAVTENYRKQEDWLSNFIDECCVREGNARAGARELYTRYRGWAESSGEYVRRENDFSTALETAGYQRITPQNRKMWVGLRLDLGQIYGNPCAATG